MSKKNNRRYKIRKETGVKNPGHALFRMMETAILPHWAFVRRFDTYDEAFEYRAKLMEGSKDRRQP